MKCEQCGEENLEGASFCKKCGNNFKEDNKQDNYPIVQNTNKENNNSLAVFCQCGQKLEQNWKFCPKCKTPITIEIKSTTNIDQDKNIKDSNAGLYIATFVISIACGYYLRLYWGFLIAIITIITGKIKYPNNKAIKVLFWLTILFIILYVILITWIIVTCTSNLT